VDKNSWLQATVTSFLYKYPQEAHVDKKAKVVTTPAYMCEAPLHQIFDGIGNMVSAVINFIK